MSALLPPQPGLDLCEAVGPAEASDDVAGLGVGDAVSAVADRLGVAARVLASLVTLALRAGAVPTRVTAAIGNALKRGHILPACIDV